MKQNFERQIMYRLILFMLIVTSCSDNKAEGYEPQTPFGKDIATTSIVSEMFWDRIFELRDGVTVTETYFKTGVDFQHIFVAEVDLTKVTFTPGTKDDLNVPATGAESDAILPYHAYAAEKNGKKYGLA